jgi:hypothetical protein
MVITDGRTELCLWQLGRLTDATGPYGDIDYAYDAADSRTSRSWSGSAGKSIEVLILAATSNRVEDRWHGHA